MAQQVPLKLTGTPIVPTAFVGTDTVPPTNLAPSPTNNFVLTANSSATAGMQWSASGATASLPPTPDLVESSDAQGVRWDLYGRRVMYPMDIANGWRGSL